LTAADERILCTKHFFGTAQFIAQCHSHIQCGTSTVALEDVPQGLSCAPRHEISPHAALERTRANIEGGADKSCPGDELMDLFVVVIIAAMLFTVATVFLGVLTMSAGGSTDKALSTPLMWTRVGCQAITLLLLFIAIRLR
jgi:hypothetical protein